jgi:prolyl-tRNA synthetase
MSSTKIKTAITPTREENYAEWYLEVIKAAKLAENAPVRGCMTIMPWGYAVWENMQRIMDDAIKATGHQNAYFPLMIPLSFMQKEAEHVEGFAKECAVVTHHRLATNEEGKLVPAGQLEEPYIIRPTSETIIGEAFSRWIQSYRDLPLLINQWCNIVRWEMRTRLFLRTTEFLWQEGHTAHATSEEAMEESRLMLDIYTRFAQDTLAIPVVQGEKTPSERFPGADITYCIEAMMQDKKALQAGTSHFLGQHFSKSFDIQYLSAEGKQEHVWTTSWGSTTRLLGALIMTHSDDDGLVLPPKVAPQHVVILPVIRNEADKPAIMAYCEDIAKALRAQHYNHQPVRVDIDKRDLPGGDKTWGAVKRGVPVRIEIGSKDMASNSVFMGRRDQAYSERKGVARDEFIANIVPTLESIQHNLFERAKAFMAKNTVKIDSKEAFYEFFKGDGGFALAHWNGDAGIEAKVKEDLSVTIRCIPLNDTEGAGKCIFTGEPSKQRVVFAKAY